MKDLLTLFWTFFRIGGLTFGGGIAMFPMLQKEVVDKRNWVKREELMDYYAIGQCTPGIIAVNTAIFVGYQVRGVWGGIVSALGVCTPSIIIITIIAAFISNFTDIEVVKYAFVGIRVCVCVLIFNSVRKLWKNAVRDLPALCIFLAVFLGSLFTDWSTILFVVFAGVMGILIQMVWRRIRANKNTGGEAK